MRTTDKRVTIKIRELILEGFGRNHGYDDETQTPEDNLIMQLKALDYIPGLYNQAKRLASDGHWFVYNNEAKEWLDSLGINPTAEVYSDEESWELYTHLMAREMVKIVEKHQR